MPTARADAVGEPGSGKRSLTLLRGSLLALAIVVVVQAALGFAGFLNAAPAVIAGIAVSWAIGTFIHRRRHGARMTEERAATDIQRQTWTAADCAGGAALVAALAERTWTGLHRTTFLYDVLSYHLHLPASWRAAGGLTLVPTPFGDPAPAYTPSNAELVYHLALAATGNATLAHAGQIPFAALAVLAIYATACVLGTTRATGFAAALGFLLIPEVWQQAPTAMADLALASLFLATIPFLLRLEGRRTWPDLVALGLALGLLVGTKYVAVVMSLPVLSWAALLLARRRPGIRRGPAIGVVAGLIGACGGFWYVRNAILTGNPLFPATLRIGSVTLAAGLLDGPSIRASDYHVPVGDLQPLLEIVMEIGWGAVAALGLGLVAARRSRWPALALLMAACAWFVVPFQQSRFFFPVWGIAAILLATATTRSPRLGGAALAAATLGAILQFPTPGRLALLGAAAAGAALGPRLCTLVAHAGRRASPGFWFAARCALGGVGVIATLGWPHARTDAPPYRVGDHHDDGWAWMRAHAHGRRVAYTGSNLPLPLWGPGFDNDVRYVNISGGPNVALHDFDHVPPPAVPTAEPAPERQVPDQATWLSKLDAHRVDLVFVASLYPGVRRTMAHDDGGFPIERAWAETRPDRFSLAFASDGIRIYHHRQRGRGGNP